MTSRHSGHSLILTAQSGHVTWCQQGWNTMSLPPSRQITHFESCSEVVAGFGILFGDEVVGPNRNGSSELLYFWKYCHVTILNGLTLPRGVLSFQIWMEMYWRKKETILIFQLSLLLLCLLSQIELELMEHHPMEYPELELMELQHFLQKLVREYLLGFDPLHFPSKFPKLGLGFG